MPNTMIRAVRESRRLSQEEMAALIRAAGDELGEPNTCDRRTVQRWEAGSVSYPQRALVRAIEHATGYSIDNLGFDHVPRHGRLSDHTDTTPVHLADDTRPTTVDELPGTLTGIWESRCTYHSGSRGEDFTDRAHLVVVHAGSSVTARSIDGAVTDDGSITLHLELRGHVVTGTWEQVTGPVSYYRGQVFYGAVQLVVEPGGGRMIGAWCGFGRDHDVNTGPWELILRQHDTRDVDDYAQVPAA